MTISKIHAREVLDSRGNPTVEVEVFLSDGSTGRAIVPSGASKGQNEALELRDGDPKRYNGKGVLKAVAHVNSTLSKALCGKHFGELSSLDFAMLELDGTKQKSKLGANALLGVSLAYAQAVAHSQKRPLFLTLGEEMGVSQKNMCLPIPLMNVMNGGEHANNSLDIQEFMIVPHGFESFKEALRAGCEVFHTLKDRLNKKGYSVAVGDEGGFAPDLKSDTMALEFLCEAIEGAGYKLGSQVSLALDVAASSFYQSANQTYEFSFEGKRPISKDTLMDFYGSILDKFNIVSIEDGLEEADWKGWAVLTERFGKKVQLVGDDLFVTNKEFLQLGIDDKVANAILIKVNQIGTLAETIETMALARAHKYACVVSHRSGETEDTTIAHLAVGSGCGQIKTGSLSRAERTAKYNELLRIEEWSAAQGTPLPLAKHF
ncbi:MAG: phosphopyruvate hydratase [Bdellovibrionaceae bacterium]|nr:phosphopyruvate hydratase [Pseudobdellovibrionaceae bacterium]